MLCHLMIAIAAIATTQMPIGAQISFFMSSSLLRILGFPISFAGCWTSQLLLRVTPVSWLYCQFLSEGRVVRTQVRTPLLHVASQVGMVTIIVVESDHKLTGKTSRFPTAPSAAGFTYSDTGAPSSLSVSR